MNCIETRRSDPQTQAVHDLRNLFGIVASGTRLLERQTDPARSRPVLNAMLAAAERGASLTSQLLMEGRDPRTRRFDAAEALRDLAPLVRTKLAGHVLQLELPSEAVRIAARQADFDAVVLELVTNAERALGPIGSLRLRARRIGGQLHLVVADSGCGMRGAPIGTDTTLAADPSAHGHGLAFVRRFARDAHGNLRIRSKAGLGTVVKLTLPIVLGLAHGRHNSAAAKDFQHKEVDHGFGQQIAA